MKKLIIVFAFFIGLISCSENKNDEMVEDKKELSNSKKYYLWYNHNPIELFGEWKIKKINKNGYEIGTHANIRIAQEIHFKIDTSLNSNTYIEKHIRKSTFNSEIDTIKKYKYWRYLSDRLYYSEKETEDVLWIYTHINDSHSKSMEFNNETLKIYYDNNIYNYNDDFLSVTYEKIKDHKIDKNYMILMDLDKYKKLH